MKNKYIPAVLLCSFLFAGWGSVGHRIINKNFILSNNPSLNFLSFWSDSLAAHGSDADNRKGSDPAEGPKHYIDIDSYPGFLTNHRIIQNYDSAVAAYGLAFMIDQGTLPWATLTAMDSLTAQFRRKDWQKAMLTASDLGHYVADGHMPLHICTNYNGQLTGQTGIHSRYESSMIGKYTSELVYTGDSSYYINDIQNFVFGYIYSNFVYVDSVLIYDNQAKTEAGGSTSSTTYYAKLWQKTKPFTLLLFKNASNRLASLIYTAWVNAGRPGTVSGTDDYKKDRGGLFKLENYPNPFSGRTTVRYQESESVKQETIKTGSVKIYDSMGREIVTVFSGELPAGVNEFEFDPAKYALSGGIYFCRLDAGGKSVVNKLLYIK